MVATQLALTVPLAWLELLAELVLLDATELDESELDATELDATELLLLGELTLEATLELLETRLEVVLELLPTMPKGAGWALQVLAEIQLWLFSQPQPLWVVTHRG